ncbi:hypothetical protein BEL04_18705 [Mucilaginibacter sp. PPCGB 2223]|uniref:DUF4350 domain-containing protein n=1 Tax=Mucilaginibacter sp. PPCGB 2223 TaxID=1886027 RepID=UPI000825B22B|nr:DUF4350 domain-containing protein [Mucilaginibacter sp. PPCGB 2223]OCX50765.1 hypothetical protein BEL04_18705 [Mucilaginibacter sp. PPCGB 2223]
MKDLKIYIIIASVLVGFYLVAEYNKPKPIDWSPTLINTDKIPLGTYILYNQLPDIFKGARVIQMREPVYNVIADHDFKNAAYIIITDNLKLTDYDYGKLTRFIKQGNDVFISASSFGNELEKELKLSTSQPYSGNGYLPSINFISPGFDSTTHYAFKRLGQQYFNELDTAKTYVIAKNSNGKSTLIRYQFGEGSLYLCTNPFLFTNYTMLQPQGADFVAKALSVASKNRPTVIWDEFYTQGRDGDESLMRVFLRNPSLRTAYYICLITMAIFVLYEMKRRQRIIPIIEPLRNSSVDFVNVVGQVYYEQRNNSNIAQKKAVYFLEYIRTRYYLRTNLLNEELVEVLSQKSGADTALLHQLFNQINIIRSGVYISDNDLISFNRNIEQFYIQSR